MNALWFKLKWFVKYRAMLLFHDKSEKNVGLVVNSFNKGGLEQMVLSLYRAYKAHGWNVYILSAFNDAPLARELDDLRDVYIFNNSPEQLIAFCYQKHINVLHYHYNTLLMRAAKQMGIKVLYTMHNVYSWFTNDEFAAYAARLCKADYIVAVSDYVKAYYVKRAALCAGSALATGNVIAIPNGVDFARLDAQPNAPHLTRAALGIAENAKTIVFVGSFNPVKHQIGMLGVMEKLVLRHPEAMLLYLGSTDNTAYFSAFETALAACGAKANVRLLAHIDNGYIGAFLRECADIFTLPTLQEGFGLSTFEAVYAAKPVVITETGAADCLRQYKSCIVVPAAYADIVTTDTSEMNRLSLQTENRNTDALVNAFCEILEHLDEYNAEAAISAKAVSAYSVQRMTDEYIRLIEQ